MWDNRPCTFDGTKRGPACKRFLDQDTRPAAQHQQASGRGWVYPRQFVFSPTSPNLPPAVSNSQVGKVGLPPPVLSAHKLKWTLHPLHSGHWLIHLLRTPIRSVSLT
jgi:hypothetical protein